MSPVCRIVVDCREPLDRIPRALRQLGIAVAKARLSNGDYALPNGVVVDRKTVYGFHDSLTRGTFWPQLGRLRGATRAPYLLVEGRNLHAGRLAERAVIGAILAVVGQGVPVLWSSDEFETAEWLAALARRAAGRQPVRDRPAYAQARPGRVVSEAMLAAVPGISTKRARALLCEFGNIAAIVSADDDALRSVPGMGAVQAGRLRAAFLQPSSGPGSIRGPLDGRRGTGCPGRLPSSPSAAVGASPA
jgi:ERCC4-type nuclease